MEYSSMYLPRRTVAIRRSPSRWNPIFSYRAIARSLSAYTSNSTRSSISQLSARSSSVSIKAVPTPRPCQSVCTKIPTLPTCRIRGLEQTQSPAAPITVSSSAAATKLWSLGPRPSMKARLSATRQEGSPSVFSITPGIRLRAAIPSASCSLMGRMIYSIKHISLRWFSALYHSGDKITSGPAEKTAGRL